MSDEPINDVALARSGLLQVKFLAVLEDPTEAWSQQPLIVAHSVAELLWKVLAVILQVDPGRRAWALEMLDILRARVLEAASDAAGGRKH